jgi:hypothetical protein
MKMIDASRNFAKEPKNLVLKKKNISWREN